MMIEYRCLVKYSHLFGVKCHKYLVLSSDNVPLYQGEDLRNS